VGFEEPSLYFILKKIEIAW